MSETEWRKWYANRRDQVLRQIARLETLADIAKSKDTTADMASQFEWTKLCLQYTRETLEVLSFMRLREYEHARFHAGITTRLDNLEKRIKATEADVTKSLRAIQEWMRTYQPTLDEATRYFADKLERVSGVEQ